MATQISPQNVVGRDHLIERIWQQVHQHSLRFTAERRIGKTTVMKKLAAEPPDGWLIQYLDLEKVDSPRRFTEVLLTALKPWLSHKDKVQHAFRDLIGALGGTEIGGIVKLPDLGGNEWQAPLEKALGGICEHNSNVMLLLLFDELPYMLQKISALEKRSSMNTNAALSILDTLRATLSIHSNLRMIFAGSVGLHHVINNLRGNDFAAQPTNHMPIVEIGPLNLADAKILAKQLMQQEGVNVATHELDNLAAEIADLSDRVPFYIERVVAKLSEIHEPVSIDNVRLVVKNCLTDDLDHWEMEHFRTRLGIYYPGFIDDANGKSITRVKLAVIVLDFLARAPHPHSIDEVWTAVKAQIALSDRAVVVDVLRLLSLDHYLFCDNNKHYAFRFPLIKRWWNLAQGLEA